MHDISHLFKSRQVKSSLSMQQTTHPRLGSILNGTRTQKKGSRERKWRKCLWKLRVPGEYFFISPPHTLPTVASGGWLGERQSSCRLQVSRVSCASICTAHDSHSARGSRRSRARISLARNSRLEPQLSLSLAVPRLCALNVIDIQTLKNMNESIS